MITSEDLDDVIFPSPDDKIHSQIEKLIGIDSEAYMNGKPFMFCTSLGDLLTLDDFPKVFFESRYVNANFMVYNIKYDSGAILRFLSRRDLATLRATGSVIYLDDTDTPYKISYLPHKSLTITRRKEKVCFWDILQFYKCSLDVAAKRYLNDKKFEVTTKRFTKPYVKSHWKILREYCIQDAKLTQQLGVFLIKKLNALNIEVSSLYSCASISYKYFNDNAIINTARDLWYQHRDEFGFICDAYQGGKFEVTSRGLLKSIEYDISSAYPYEIGRLISIENATIIRDPAYLKDATYGFLRVRIDNSKGYHLPCGLAVSKDNSNVRVYPAGSYHTTITKEEYDYICSLEEVPIYIYDAVWIITPKKQYLYEEVVDKLYKLKSDFKGKDPMLYNVVKIILNSFYGKTCQVTPDRKTEKNKLGQAFNPVHAAVITANTRIKICKIQNLHRTQPGFECYAVHTDSVMVNKPIPDCYLSDGMGGFEYVAKGDAIILSCGVYQIGETCAFKGFKMPKGETWIKILSSDPKAISVKYPQMHAESWVEAMAKNHSINKINVFEEKEKEIKFNVDNKRIWPTNFKAEDFLTKCEHSLPKLVIENEVPKFWTKKERYVSYHPDRKIDVDYKPPKSFYKKISKKICV
jgi:hypothetical protein